MPHVQSVSDWISKGFNFPEITIAGLAVNELVWRGLANLDIVSLIEVLVRGAESPATAAVLSLLSFAHGTLSTIGLIAGYLFFFAIAYEVIPKIYPGRMQSLAEEPGYRVVAAALSVVTAYLFSVFLLVNGSWAGSTDIGQYLLIVFKAGAVFFLILTPILALYIKYLVRKRQVDWYDLARMTSTRWDDSSRLESRTMRWEIMIYLPVVLISPIFVFSLVIELVGLAFPLPEIIAIGYAAIVGVESHTNRSPSDILPSSKRADLEVASSDLAKNVLQNEKGIGTTLCMLMIFGVSLSYFSLGISLLPSLSRAGLSIQDGWYMGAWRVIGYTVSILGAGSYSVWYSTRLVRRIPNFLIIWRQQFYQSAEKTSEDLGPYPALPKDYTLASSITLLAAVVALLLHNNAYYVTLRGPILFVYTLLWPISFGAFAYFTWDAVRRSPEHPFLNNTDISGEYAVVPIVLSIQFGLLVLSVYSMDIIKNRLLLRTNSGEFVVIGGLSSDTRIAGLVLLLALLTLLFTNYIPDIYALRLGSEGWTIYIHDSSIIVMVASLVFISFIMEWMIVSIVAGFIAIMLTVHLIWMHLSELEGEKAET